MNHPSVEKAERERAEFEKWGNAKGAHVERSWNGEFYENRLVESAWQGWQAARTPAAPETPRMPESFCFECDNKAACASAETCYAMHAGYPKLRAASPPVAGTTQKED